MFKKKVNPPWETNPAASPTTSPAAPLAIVINKDRSIFIPGENVKEALALYTGIFVSGYTQFTISYQLTPDDNGGMVFIGATLTPVTPSITVPEEGESGVNQSEIEAETDGGAAELI
jgi:hypothetical protein